ncbi:hypothetical protein N7470_007409 [Penicillium chermesinum]|nr:hypothetical protein N7470_007409 [Penicillium chermesinum]
MKTRLVAFALLPLLPHRASELPTRQSLVLGFDLRNHRIQAYFFECCPEGIADLGSAWEEGQLIIDVHVDRFLEMYVFVCTVDLDILSTGLFNYFRETTRELPVGLDLVVVIKFAELLSDIAHLIWDDPQPYRDSHHGSDFKLRDLLRKTSFDALVAAVRQNQTCEAYSQQRDGKPILTRQLILDESPASEPSPVEQVPAVHVQVQQPQAVKGATPRAPVWAQSSCAYSMLQMVSQLTQ